MQMNFRKKTVTKIGNIKGSAMFSIQYTCVVKLLFFWLKKKFFIQMIKKSFLVTCVVKFKS